MEADGLVDDVVQVFNQVVLIILLIIFNSGHSHPPYTTLVAQYVYRVSFGLIAILHLWLIYYRVYKIKCKFYLLPLFTFWT